MSYGKIYETTYWGVGRDNDIGWGNVYKDLGVSTDADYQAVLDKGTTEGYTLPSASQQEHQNTLVTDLKSAGVWSKLDVLYVFATDGDSNFATLNFKSPSSYQATKVNAPTHSANGFTGENSAQRHLDTNFNPATASSPNFVSGDGSVGVYIKTASSVNAQCYFGNDAYGTTMREGSTDKLQTKPVGIAGNSNNQLAYFTHTDANESVQIWDTTVKVTDATIGSVADRGNFAILAEGTSGTSTRYSVATIGLFFIGSAIADSERTDLYNAINTYMTA